MKIALVDDENECLAEMEKFCHDFGVKTHNHVEAFSFSSGEAFCNALNETSFFVVFMDIYLKGADGITAARKLREKDKGCLLVFLTSSTEFMPDAFSLHAFEYICKPILAERIERVLTDAFQLLPATQKYIEITSSRKTVPVFLHDIISVVTDAHYLELNLADETALRCRMTIAEFLLLTKHDPRFISTNRGVLLNAEHISAFGNGCCILNNGEKFPIRVRDSRRIEQSVIDYNFKALHERQKD